jgi:hypothetical protein
LSGNAREEKSRSSKVQLELHATRITQI